MEEKTYKIMHGVGALNIALGVVVLVTGLAAGVLMLVGGGRLLSGKNKVLF